MRSKLRLGVMILMMGLAGLILGSDKVWGDAAHRHGHDHGQMKGENVGGKRVAVEPIKKTQPNLAIPGRMLVGSVWRWSL